MSTQKLKENNLITGHMIVRNDDRWVWFAINSVLNYVSRLIIYDTGSTDNTVEIIKSIKSKKIEFTNMGSVDSNDLTKLRQSQIERTDTDWFMIIDADEVWPEKSIESVVNKIKKADRYKLGIVVKTGICVGDIYHFQDENAGKYKIGEKQGHYNIRFFKKNKDYHWGYPYPSVKKGFWDEAYVDKNNNPIQNTPKRLIFTDILYWHLRHLPRSSIISNKNYKLELGYKIDSKIIPEVFQLERPDFVPSPWIKYSLFEYLSAALLTPLRKINRKISN